MIKIIKVLKLIFNRKVDKDPHEENWGIGS